MTRISFHITDAQREGLEKASRENHIRIAELVRMAIDRFLDSQWQPVKGKQGVKP